MSYESDCVYYDRRSKDEFALGEKAASASTASIHFELAYRYALLAQGIPTLRRNMHDAPTVPWTGRSSEPSPLRQMPRSR